MNRRDQKNEDSRIANEAYRDAAVFGYDDHDGSMIGDRCDCGRDNCPGGHQYNGPTFFKDKIWDKIVDGVKKINPEADVTKTKKNWYGKKRRYSGDGSIHPACAAEALGRPLRRKDFVNDDPVNAERWVDR